MPLAPDICLRSSVYLGSLESLGDWPPPASAAGPPALCQTKGWRQVTAPCPRLEPLPPPQAQPAAPTAAAQERPALGVFLNKNR